jgi:hypothetical protein
MEPYRLRRWRLPLSQGLKIYTCGRPGRSKGADVTVGDAIVDKWIKGLPGDGNIAIMSLLGRKHGANGDSEFKFYSFHGALDHASERRRRPSFQEWIARRNVGRSIEVVEHPTYDFKPIPKETLEAVAVDLHRLLAQNLCIVLMDSGGETRVRRVCEFINFVEDSANP